MIADLPSRRDDVLALGERIDRLTAPVEALASRLPSTWISLTEATVAAREVWL